MEKIGHWRLRRVDGEVVREEPVVSEAGGSVSTFKRLVVRAPNGKDEEVLVSGVSLREGDDVSIVHLDTTIGFQTIFNVQHPYGEVVAFKNRSINTGDGYRRWRPTSYPYLGFIGLLFSLALGALSLWLGFTVITNVSPMWGAVLALPGVWILYSVYRAWTRHSEISRRIDVLTQN